MGAKCVVHVVSTGTLGEPVVSLWLSLQQNLAINEIMFHNRVYNALLI
jgi:hypothetical protein